MNRQQVETIKRKLATNGINTDSALDLITEHAQLNGQTLVDSVNIRDGNVSDLNPNLEPPFICEFEVNKTSLYNTPKDEHRIEFCTTGKPTLTSFTGDEMIHFTTNKERIKDFVKMTHPIHIMNVQNNNCVQIQMATKKVEVLTMVESLGDDFLGNFLVTDSSIFYFENEEWRHISEKELGQLLHHTCKTRVKMTKEIESYLGNYKKFDFVNAIENLRYKRINTELNQDIFPMIGSRVENGKIVPSARSDFILSSCGWRFDEQLALERADDLNEFIYKLFPVPEERRVMLKFCASLLHGHRTEKKFVILTDERGGDNGKSTWVNFLCGFFGGLSYNNTRLFLNSTMQDKNGQDTILYKVFNKRLVVGSEFKDGMKLDVSLMKKLTGMDPISGRHFHSQEDFSFMSQAGVILVYNQNDGPREDFGDDAYQHRKLLFKMKSKFVKGLKQDDASTFTFRSKKIVKRKKMNSAFLKLLMTLNTDWDDVDEKMEEDSSDWHIEIENYLSERVVKGRGFVQLQKLYRESGIRCKSKEFCAIARNILVARGGKFQQQCYQTINSIKIKFYNVVSGMILQ